MLCNNQEEHDFWEKSQKLTCPRCAALRVAERESITEDAKLDKLAELIADKVLQHARH